MNSESDDYQQDIRFGEWLRAQRSKSTLTLEDAARKAEMQVQRLKTLETGLSEQGITRAEAARLAAAYGISLDNVLAQAIR